MTAILDPLLIFKTCMNPLLAQTNQIKRKEKKKRKEPRKDNQAGAIAVFGHTALREMIDRRFGWDSGLPGLAAAGFSNASWNLDDVMRERQLKMRQNTQTSLNEDMKCGAPTFNSLVLSLLVMQKKYRRV